MIFTNLENREKELKELALIMLYSAQVFSLFSIIGKSSVVLIFTGTLFFDDSIS